MSSKKATGAALTLPAFKKGMSARAIMPPVTITAPPASLTLQIVDNSTPPNPVVLQPTDNVIGALNSDNPAFAVAQGADTLHWTATLAVGIPMGTVVNLSATLTGTIAGAAVSFTASVAITVNISPPLPVATDLEIILG
jgi:hypothetical protein